MGRDNKEKSIIERFADTLKGIADSASEALKTEEPPKADEAAAAYMPFAAEGLVSDALPVPPVAAQPVRKRKRGAKKTAKRGPAKAGKKATSKKAARKPAKKSARARSSGLAKKSTRTARPATATRREKKSGSRRGRR